MWTMSEQPLDPDFLDRALMTPIRLATETAVAGSGAFLIDPDHAEQFIAEVRTAADTLDDAKDAATQAGAIDPPGGDAVTENAVIQAKKMADNAWRALDVYQQQLIGTAAELQAQLAAYQATEQANRAGQA